jgi:signal transduction histidine kinase
METNVEHLLRVSQEILRLADLSEICRRMALRLRELLNCESVNVWLTDQSQNHVLLYVQDQYATQRPEGLDHMLHEGPLRQVLDLGDSLEVPVQPGRLPEVFAPLKMQGRIIGVVAVRGASGPSALQVTSFLASQAAAAIETSRLYQAEEHRLRVEEALIQSGRRLSQDPDPSEMPARILEQLNQVVPYVRGSLMMQDGNVLRIEAQRGFPDDERVNRLFVPLRPGDVYSQISETGYPVVIEDVTTDEGWQQVEWLPLNLSWLGIPLFAKERVVGMVSLTRKERGAFSPEDVLMASTFAIQAGVALENASLYEEVVHFNQVLEQTVRERTEELRQALQELERLDRHKSNFIGVAAHELRTPLTVMKGYLGIMQNDNAIKTNAFLLQAVAGVLKGTERLHEVVNRMLDLVRIENQVLEIRLEMMPLGPVLKRIRTDFKDFFVERNISLEMINLDDLPMIRGDSALLLKVFQNLIINAIKYTPDGRQITVSGHQVEDEKLGDCVEIRIQDQGIGIDPSQLEIIFEKLSSLGSVALHSTGKASFKGGGPGLGLAIARGIVNAHGGRIWATSQGHDEEKFPGSCFYVRLPRQNQAPS